MKKILALAVAAAALASSSPAWAGEGYTYFDRCGRRTYHRGTRVSLYYTAPVCAPVVRYPVRYYRETACATPVQGLGQVVVINVSNANGSYTPVTLRQEGGTYIGPRGEHYMQMPTEEQLRQVYGLK